MTPPAQSTELTKEQKDARGLVKTTAILSIIFGSIGLLVGILAVLAPPSSDFDGTPFDHTMVIVLAIILWIIPHIFLIIGGIKLIVFPRKAIAKGLIIAILVIGAIWNVILLVFSVINLTQLSQYLSNQETGQ